MPELFINFNESDESTINPIIPMSCINNSDNPFVKFLGVYFDPNLNFKKHISYINSKLSKSLYFLKTSKNILNERAQKFFYYSTFHSHLVYANQIWTSTFESNLKHIFVKQKAAIRIISKANYNAHTEPLFKSLTILPFPKLTEFFKLQFMHNYIYGYLPVSFENTWTTNRIRRDGQAQVELRNDDGINIPYSRTRLSGLQPLIAFPSIWENFPEEEIKFQRNHLEFGARLKKFYLDGLSQEVICNRLLCPACLGT
jgi:hypothetical protein